MEAAERSSVAPPRTTVDVGEVVSTSTTVSIEPQSSTTNLPTTRAPAPPATVVSRQPAPTQVLIDFDVAPGASMAEQDRLEQLASQPSVASVVEVDRTTGGSLSPDGTRIVVPGTGELCIVVLRSGEESCSAVPEDFGSSQAGEFHLPLLWSPNSEFIAVASASSNWGDETWVFDLSDSSFTLVSGDDEFNGQHTPLAWNSDSTQVIVVRASSDRDLPGEIVVVDLDGNATALLSQNDSHLLWQLQTAAISPDIGVILATYGDAVRLDESGSTPLVPVEFAVRTAAVTEDGSTVAFVSTNSGSYQPQQGPTFLVDVLTGDSYEVPGEAQHVMFDPTGTWVATVTSDTATEPPTHKVAVAPVTDPKNSVEVFSSNADEYFARSKRGGRRQPGISPPSPHLVWSDEGTLLIPLTEQGTILVIKLGA